MRLRLCPPQLHLELQLPSGLSETLSSATQVAAAPADRVGAAVWGAEAVVAVVAVVDVAVAV